MGANAFTIFQNRDKSMRITLTDSNGAAIDTTGWRLIVTVRRCVGDADPALIVKDSDVGGDFSQTAGGAGMNVWIADFVAADTVSLPPFVNSFDVKAISDTAEPFQAVSPDLFTILEPVTT